MKKPVFAAVAGVLGAMVLAGCAEHAHERLAPGEVYTNQVSAAFADLRPDDVLVKINAHALTKAGLDERIADDLAVSQAVNADFFAKASAELERYKLQLRARCLNRFLVHAVVLDEARRRKVQPAADDLKAANEMIEKICTLRKITRQAYVETFAEKEKAVARRMTDEATMRALFRAQFGDKLLASDKEALDLQNEIKEGNKGAEQTNALVKASLEQLAEKLRATAGGKPSDLLPEITRQLPAGMVAEKVEKRLEKEFTDAEVTEALAGLPVLQWSPVVELEETFDLYFIADRQKDDEAKQYRYDLIRVYAKRDLGFVEPSLEELKNDIARRKREALQAPWVLELLKKARVSYPKGVAWLER
ncbi:MAG TPA: hypothetical protein PKM57_00530 [Kiritimatiellia bacterium]|nr:hypothetical protein [Kiritimatiellia bacterium]HPS06402.1 hypothetical protein [Kiritimatiellia bacterium]